MTAPGAPNGNTGRLVTPSGVAHFLTSIHYGVSLLLILIGLITVVVNIRSRLDGIEEREKEHPTKTELSSTEIRFGSRIEVLERHIEEINKLGTRSSSDQLALLQERLNQISREILILTERQNVNSNTVKDLQAVIKDLQRLSGTDGPAMPPPINQPQRPPHGPQ